MSPPGLTAPKTSGGSTSAEATSQTQLVNDAHKWLADAGVAMSPSKVSRLVRQFEARVAANGWSLHQFLANTAQLSAEQRRKAVANSDLRRVISYADPTGERAVSRVLREKRGPS